jgi:hypothetical protein
LNHAALTKKTGPDRLPVYRFICLWIVLFCAAAMHIQAGDAGDKNLLLMCADMLLSGRKLYTDIFEIDPPLILWIYTLPVYLHKHVGLLQDYQWLALLGLGTVALCVALSARLIRQHPYFAGDATRQRMFVLLLASVFITVTNPSFFFDREHMLLVLTFPYVLCRLPSLYPLKRSRRMQLLIGVMTAIGICIKPHTLIVFAGLQVLLLIRQRSWRVLFACENIVIALGGAFYLLVVWHFLPQYFTVILPMALETYYAFNRPVAALPYLLGALFTAGLPLVDFRLRDRSPLRQDILFLFALAMLWLSYALINGGWGYTYNPLISMLLVFNGFMLWEYRFLRQENAVHDRRFMQGAYACMANFAISLCATLLVITNSCGACLQFDKGARLVAESFSRSFGSMVVNFNVVADIFRITGITPSTRFTSMWMLPELFSADPLPPKRRWIAEYVAQSMAEDLTRARPGIVIVDNSPRLYQTTRQVDLVGYFKQYAAFAAAWQPYHLRTTVNSCSPSVQSGPHAQASCRFDIYQREPSVTP